MDNMVDGDVRVFMAEMEDLQGTVRNYIRI